MLEKELDPEWVGERFRDEFYVSAKEWKDLELENGKDERFHGFGKGIVYHERIFRMRAPSKAQRRDFSGVVLINKRSETDKNRKRRERWRAARIKEVATNALGDELYISWQNLVCACEAIWGGYCPDEAYLRLEEDSYEHLSDDNLMDGDGEEGRDSAA